MSLMRFMALGRRPFDLAVRVAGSNGFGELSRPAGVAVTVLTAPAAPVTDPQKWAGFSIIGSHAVAVHTDGRLFSTGSNSAGQLGLGDLTNRATLTQIGSATNWVKAGTGLQHTVALNSLGEIWTCGRNDIAASIGDGTKTGADFGGRVFGRNVLYNTGTTPAPFWPSGKIWTDISVGHRFTLALDTDSECYSWGNNGSRQCGRGFPGFGSEAPNNAGTTQDYFCLPIDIPGPWRKITAGGYHAAALHETTREVWAWGQPGSGQRSTFFPATNNGEPQIIPCNDPSKRWVDVSCGEYTTHLLRDDGTLWGCGSNTEGQVGVGTYTNVTALTQVTGDWVYISGGYYHTLGIGLDGLLYGWGRNISRQLGNASLTASNYNTPQLISADTGWNAAHAGEAGTIATRIVV